MRYLVTGGAGFIGSHLVEALVESGHEVVVLDNLRRGSRANLTAALQAGGVRLIEGDVRDLAAVQRSLEGVGAVFHLAAQSNVLGAIADPEYSFSTNVGGTFSLLRAAAAAGVSTFVFASSREVYGEPEELPVPETATLAAKNAYGASKIAAEAYCRAWQQEAAMRCAVLRFANIYGPRDRDRVIPRWLDLARRGLDIPVYGGGQVMDFLPVRTAVEALLRAAQGPCSGPVNVGSGCGVGILDLARRIIDSSGAGIGLRLLPARGAEVVRFVADVSRMRAQLGLEPPQDPLCGLAELAASPCLAPV